MSSFAASLAADELHRGARTVGEQAGSAALLSQSLVWNSVGGTAFRARALALCLELATLSARLDAAAAAVRTLRCPP